MKFSLSSGNFSLFDFLFRIHYGKFVAEVKFRGQTKAFTALIESRDTDGIMKLITNVAVEDKVQYKRRVLCEDFRRNRSLVAKALPHR